MKKMSYVHGTSDIPLIGETIGENLRRTVLKFGNRPALIVKEQNVSFTYQQLWDATTIVAKGLLAKGVEKGDRVGIWAANRYEWVLMQFSTARIGVILVNINPAFKSSGLNYALKQSGTSLLVASETFRTSNYREILSRVIKDCPKLKQTVFLGEEWEKMLEEGKNVSDAQLETVESILQFDDPINIQYTSGTTGYPKGATLSHHNILNNGFFIGERMFYTEKDRVCIPVPFYHCFGMVLGNLACTTHGACMIIPGESFDPEAVLRTVQEEKCTSLYGVPTMFIAELDLPLFSTFDLSSLRTGIMAGSPCPIETMREVISTMNMREITICYGMTETSPVSTQSFADDKIEKRVTTVGKVHPHVEIKIVDPKTNSIVSIGDEGELCTRGYSVMLGYWDNEADTRLAIDNAGWMHTGDLARMDNEGYLKITGRIKDIILRGGENISAREIEEFIHSHEKVKDVQVIGVPSVKYGEEVMAWVVLKNGSILSEKELFEYCKGQIATYKIPKYWKFVDEFPMTITGKIRKVEMREISTKELKLHVAANIQTA